MKLTTLYLAATAACAVQAAAVHRRHDHHKRDGERRVDYAPIIALDPQNPSQKVVKRSPGHRVDYSPAIELIPGHRAVKRGAYGANNDACKPVKTGAWVPVKNPPEAAPAPCTTEAAAAEQYTPPAKPYAAPAASAPQPAPSASDYGKQPEGGYDSSPAEKPSSYGQPSGGGGKVYGVTYSPFTGGGCIPTDQMAKDVASMAQKGFETVRIYSSECACLETIGNACKQHGMKMIVGSFIKTPDFSDADKDLAAIIEWGKKDQGNWDHIAMVVIGNESLFQKTVTGSALAGYINQSRQKLRGAGCNAPVTTAEITGTLQESPEICQACDVIGVNVHPYFNPAQTPATAGDFLGSQMDLASKICGGKEVYVLEAGWPKVGDANGQAQPGVPQQQQAIQSMRGKDRHRAVYFSFNDEKWKPSPLEQSWGCGNLFD